MNIPVMIRSKLKKIVYALVFLTAYLNIGYAYASKMNQVIDKPIESLTIAEKLLTGEVFFVRGSNPSRYAVLNEENIKELRSMDFVFANICWPPIIVMSIIVLTSKTVISYIAFGGFVKLIGLV